MYSDLLLSLRQWFILFTLLTKLYKRVFTFTFLVRQSRSLLKSSFSEKSIKIWNNILLTLLSKNNCFVKRSGRFFQIFCQNENRVIARMLDVCILRPISWSDMRPGPRESKISFLAKISQPWKSWNCTVAL